MARAAAALLLLSPAAAGALRLPWLSQVQDAASALLPWAPDSDDLPAFFDSRLHWFGCGLTVLDQARRRTPAAAAPPP